MAQSLAEKGASLALIDLDAKAVQKVADEITSAGGKAKAYVADVRDIAALKEAKSRIAKEIGLIHGLINNAGVVRGGEFEKISLEDNRLVYEVNTIGVATVTHLFLEDLLQSPVGRLVMIASAAGLAPFPLGAAYGSSKWAVVGLAESLRLEFKERNIRNMRITTICPAYIDTGMFDGARPPFLMPILKPEKIVRKIIRAIETEQYYIREPFLSKTVEFLRVLTPVPVQDFVYRFIGFSGSMKNWKGRLK